MDTQKTASVLPAGSGAAEVVVARETVDERFWRVRATPAPGFVADHVEWDLVEHYYEQGAERTRTTHYSEPFDAAGEFPRNGATISNLLDYDYRAYWTNMYGYVVNIVAHFVRGGNVILRDTGGTILRSASGTILRG